MTPTSGLDDLLAAHLTARAALATPTPDPGPMILERVAVQRSRQQRHRAAAAAAVVMVAVVVAVVAWPRADRSHLSTRPADGTSGSGCLVSAASCTPSSVSQASISELPTGYHLASSTPSTVAGGATTIVVIYETAEQFPTGPNQSGPHQIKLTVTTETTGDVTDYLAGLGDRFKPVQVGGRAASLDTDPIGGGTPHPVPHGYLTMGLSQTVVMTVEGDYLTADQLTSMALSVAVS